MDERQYFVDAALRYTELLESGRQVSLDAFVAGEPAALRAELRAFLEFSLALGELDDPSALSPEAAARAESVIARAQAAWSAPAQNLTQLRSACGLTVGRLARQLRLPPDVLARMERGKVEPASVPARLITELATLLQETADQIREALAAPPPTVAGARLSAADGTVEREEPVVTFAQAFDESTPTPEQRTAWGQDLR